MGKTALRTVDAFTLVECLTVVGIIALVAGVLLPALAKSKQQAFRTICMGNHKNLAVAWTLYHMDQEGRLAFNPFWPQPEEVGWVQGTVHGPSAGFTNANALIGNGVALFAPYIRTARIYKCPAERVMFKVSGDTFPKLRSYSINQFVGGRIADADDKKWKLVRLDQVLSPALTFVFIDVEPPSICYGAFEIPVKDTDQWWHVPGALHNKRAILSFADNHIEQHHWQMPFNRGMESQTPTKHPTAQGATNDVHWLRGKAHHLKQD